MNNPYKLLVSIIIPSYNQGTFIRDAIESCLSQDYRPIEVLVVDGASTDNTVSVLHDYDNVPEVKWISEPDSGVAEAVNKGLLMARGEIGGIQSSDDGYLPGAVSQVVQQFSSDPGLGLVYGDCVYVDKEGKELNRHCTGSFSVESFLCKNTIILQPAAFFRIGHANEIGGWNKVYFVADTEMWLRMVFRAQAKKVDAFWGIRRVHEDQRNMQAVKIINSYNSMIDNSIDIAKACGRLRRAAKSGKFIVAAIYNPSCSNIVRFYNNWRAFLVFPGVYKQEKLLYSILPGYRYLIGKLSKLHRCLHSLKKISSSGSKQ